LTIYLDFIAPGCFYCFPFISEASRDFIDTFVSLVGDLSGLFQPLFIVCFRLVGVAHRLTGHSA